MTDSYILFIFDGNDIDANVDNSANVRICGIRKQCEIRRKQNYDEFKINSFF